MAPPHTLLLRRQWNTLHASLDWICSYRVAGGPQEIQYSPHFSAIWVHTGEVRVSMNQKLSWTQAKAGEWLFQQPGKASLDSLPDSTFMGMGFSIHWKETSSHIRPPKFLCWKSTPNAELEEKTNRLYHVTQERQHERKDLNSLYQKTDMGTHWHYTSLFYDWLACWIRSMGKLGIHWSLADPTHRIVEAAIQLMEQHPSDQPFHVADIALNAGVSPKQLTHLFQQSYGMSPKAYWLKQKLQQALHELQSTTDGMDEIACRLGYKPAWFYRWIKKETGQSPVRLRKEKAVKSIPGNTPPASLHKRVKP